MNDLPIVLFVIAIVLTIVTLVGHGIWVLLAAIFGGGRKKPSQTCPFCGRSTPAGHDRCDWCGKDLASPMARELSDLEAVRRQLQRFREKGTLKPQVVDRLLGRLQDYRQQLLQPAAAKRAAPIVAAVILEEAEPGRPAARRRPCPLPYRVLKQSGPLYPNRPFRFTIPRHALSRPSLRPIRNFRHSRPPFTPRPRRRRLLTRRRQSPAFRPSRRPRRNRSRRLRRRGPGPRCWPPSWNSGIFAGAS